MIFAFQIEHYRKIQQNVEHRINSHIYSSAPGQEKSVLALLQIETAFQNTNHEDFQPNRYEQFNFEDKFNLLSDQFFSSLIHSFFFT